MAVQAPTQVSDALAHWLQSVIPTLRETGSIPLPQLRVGPGDAGARRYFILPEYPDLLAVYTPPVGEDGQVFAGIAQYLRRQGVHAPAVYAADYQRGFMLIEYLGRDLYLDTLTAANVDQHYSRALDSLLLMQTAPREAGLLADYSAEELRDEMDLFPEWFVKRLLDHQLNTGEKKQLDALFRHLIDSALAQPQCFVHRDYHSRNLVSNNLASNNPVSNGDVPGVIDFQDAVWGPVTYDLVSLLRDCYVRWPREQVQQWLSGYGNRLKNAGVIETFDPVPFSEWFDLMGMQRHFKVLGIFARLYLRDGKPGYLSDLPLVMRYLLEAGEQWPQTRPFVQWFRETLLPLCEQQTWYQPVETAGYTPG